MPLFDDKVEEMKDLLISAAKQQSTFRWHAVFSVCAEHRETYGDEFETRVFRTLSHSALEVCPFDIAIYSSLVDRPKRGFFSMPVLKRRDIFVVAARGLSEHDLVGSNNRREIADIIIESERYRVWNHAARNY